MAEVHLDAAKVRQLLERHHPDLADQELVPLGSGWDNWTFRLGTRWVVRLPRRKSAVPLIQNEQAWLPKLANRLPLKVPTPVRVSPPSAQFRWPWSIVPWFPGQTANLSPPAPGQAQTLAKFLRALHQEPPSNAPTNELRGVPLAVRAPRLQRRLERLRVTTSLITPALLRVWDRALAAPEPPAACWLHGDLHPRNVLVQGGVITAVIDWGDLTSGDPATDLASVWMLFADPQARAEALALYGASSALQARAQGWALFFGAFLLDSGLQEDPAQAAIGKAILHRLSREPAVGSSQTR
jgi:aminoglycoside phosphotransferase (APT) family kinase protein